MRHSTYNNRKIIWESRTKQVWYVVIATFFVCASIWAKDEMTTLVFWFNTIFFGNCGLVILIQLLNPKNLYVTPETELGQKIIAEQALKEQEDPGFFEYNDRGFSFTEHTAVTSFHWQDIETIFAFKEAHITIDEICLDIFFDNKNNIRITESMLGWHQFNKHMISAFPTIQENWYENIMLPAFTTNMTLLFDKQRRNSEEAIQKWYNN